MGAAGSERSRVLGIGPKILGEQGFPPSGFPAYCSWMNEVDFSLGRAFPTAPLWRPKESWGLLGRRTSPRAGQHKGSPGCPPWTCFRGWLLTLQWARNAIHASVSFYSVRECATDKERGSQYLIPEPQPSPSSLPLPLTKKVGGVGCVCSRVADSEVSEVESRCFNEVIPELENSGFKIHFISPLSLIWLIVNF